ncbi:MAG TPA: metallophosphoesterase [Bryobacteraceae bacterium]|nr:metallophosphoesterase [Bryobacteraceae bacterium]
MRKILLLTIAPAILRGQFLSPVWVEIGEGGKAIARIVVNAAADCPALQVDGAVLPMVLRKPVPSGLRPACEVAIPPGARSASLNGQTLALPRPDPSRIVVIGDTGCRVKGPRVQDCNDPAKWPFEIVAGRAAAAKPELVIHVGDYLYREGNCPEGSAKLCGDSPSGDHWETWAADFFKPAAKLLASAPWIFARGNHEDCQRAWRGWFYYLDPRPFQGTCEAYSPPYAVKLGRFEVAVMDTSCASDTVLAPKQVDIYAAQLGSLKLHNAWLVDHHPFWAMTVVYGATAATPLTAPLEAAWEKANPKGIELVLSGHTHLFEILSFGHSRPPQIVAGDGGTDLAQAIPTTMNGMKIRGLTVSGSETRHEFGYTLLNRSATGWKLELKNPSDVTLVSCGIQGDHVNFPPVRSNK